MLFVDDNIGEVEYPASPISRAQLQELRSEMAKLRLNGTMQQVNFCCFVVQVNENFSVVRTSRQNWEQVTVNVDYSSLLGAVLILILMWIEYI